MRIEFLYWEECPSHPEALARLRAVLRDEALDVPVEVIRVGTEAEAAARGFPGSPTIRIDGADIQAPGENPIGLSCRVYQTDDGRVTPLPTAAMIRRAMRAARADRPASPAALFADAASPRSKEPERSSRNAPPQEGSLMPLAIESQVIPFALTGTDGLTHRTEEYAGAPVFGVIFHCNHCPYAQAWEDRLIAIQRDYAPRGVRFVLINANDPVKYPADDFAHMTARAAEKSYPFDYLFDETQEVARTYGATRTPEVFLFDRGGVLRYHGAPDDNYEDPQAVRHHYLRDAIDALLAGTAPATPQTKPVGCTIKWR